LEELYEDLHFLNTLESDTAFMESCDGDMGVLVSSAQSYLESRVDFWRQKNPTGAVQTFSY
jgi:hypothetical protein